jgi:hypothetical protein
VETGGVRQASDQCASNVAEADAASVAGLSYPCPCGALTPSFTSGRGQVYDPSRGGNATCGNSRIPPGEAEITGHVYLDWAARSRSICFSAPDEGQGEHDPDHPQPRAH